MVNLINLTGYTLNIYECNNTNTNSGIIDITGAIGIAAFITV